MKSVLAVMLLIAASPCLAECEKESCPVLVIDFTGNLSSEPLRHADPFTQTVLPEAPIFTIGNQGVVRDEWRGSAGYSAIINTKTPGDVRTAASRVYALTRNSTRTVLAFDMNEIIPNQVREAFADLFKPLVKLQNKTDSQAIVAAEVIAQWKAANPDGKVVVRGHSDGTYSVLALLRHLERNGLAVDAAILESVRQQYDEWVELAQSLPDTRFIDISAHNDLPPVDWRFRLASPASLPNWQHIHINENYAPFKAHGAPADYLSFQRMEISDRFGTRALENATLGGVVGYELSSVFVTGARHMLRNAGTDGRTSLTPTQLAQLRRESQADVEVENRGAPVWKEAAVEYVRTLWKLGNELAAERGLPTVDPSTDPTIAVLQDVAQVVQKDIDESHGGRFVFLRSHTLEKMGELGLDLVKQYAAQNGQQLSNIAPVLAGLDEIRTLTAVFARIVGGQFEAEDIKVIVDATASLAKKVILAEAELDSGLSKADSAVLRRLKTQLLIFDGLGDMSQAFAMRGEAGLWTLEAADKLSDALLIVGASLLTAGIARLDPDIAPYLRDTIVATGRAVRDGTRGHAGWAWLYSRTYGNRFLILDAYAQYQLAQVLRGERALDIDALYGSNELLAAGFTRKEIARSNDQTRLMNTHTAMHATRVRIETPKVDFQHMEIATREPEKPRLPEQAKLEPLRNDSLLAPSAGGRRPDAAGDGDDDERDDGGSPKGVTVDPDVQFEPLDPSYLKRPQP